MSLHRSAAASSAETTWPLHSCATPKLAVEATYFGCAAGPKQSLLDVEMHSEDGAGPHVLEDFSVLDKRKKFQSNSICVSFAFKDVSVLLE